MMYLHPMISLSPSSWSVQACQCLIPGDYEGERGGGGGGQRGQYVATWIS